MSYEAVWEKVYGFDKDPVRQLLLYPLLISLSGPLEGRTVLDVGCGNGGLLLALLPQPLKAAFGVDKSEVFLAQARNAVRDNRVVFQAQDVTAGRFPCGDGSIDVAYSVFVFNEIASLSHTMTELTRVLRVGGKFLVVTTHPFVALNYYLYEKYTGKKNPKLSAVKGYFEPLQADYIFTIAKERTPFFHHTLQDIVNGLSDSGLGVWKLHELTVTVELMERVPEYVGGDDVPRYLVIEGWKPPSSLGPS